ncbi:helix-turn-helix transcriptional regulator [Luteolibacter sp. AS25]|uniref:helix-turn-helix transcriptional regulator n=1 Tax=Luteolibacter sp. AS25 TaxID=3135776 RepID=UPI00398A9316
MNRIDRLTGMILLLQSQRVITAEQVAAHFEISVRTVYRDLAALSEAGVPIAAEAGVGYSLMRGYHMPPVMFTEDEAAALFMSAEVTGPVADDSLRESLKSALLKVRSVLPQEKNDYLVRLRDRVGIAPRNSSADIRRESLMPIQGAVVRRKCLEIRYNTANRGAISLRVIEPLGLVFYAQNWHLIGWCRMRQEMRNFRLDRIAEWLVLDESFEDRLDFSVKEFLRESIECSDLTPATVAVDVAVLERFRAEMQGTAVAEKILADGRVSLELLSFSLPWLAQWLLGFGNRVEALEPRELREHVREAAHGVSALYSRDFVNLCTPADIGLSVGGV